MLAAKLDKSKTQFQTLKFQIMTKKYEEIATSKFKIFN
jgi:hypothetical protein